MVAEKCNTIIITQINLSVTVCVITKRKDPESRFMPTHLHTVFTTYTGSFCQYGICNFTYMCVHSWKVGQRSYVRSYFSLG